MTVYEDETVRIAARHLEPSRERDDILLSFTGIGHQMGGINVQREEFFGSGKSMSNVIFISDKKKSWGNALDFGLVYGKLERLLGSSSLHSIGNSMGGFLSIHASQVFPIRTALAFAPQFSVDPSVVPRERRWREYVNAIDRFRVPSLKDSFNDRTRYYVFSSSRQHDRIQAALFPSAPNIFHAAFDDIGHNVAEALKERGVLYDLISDCLDGRDMASRMRGLGWQGLAVLSPAETGRPMRHAAGGAILPDSHMPIR